MGAIFGCKSERHTNYTHYDHQVANWERGVDVDDGLLLRINAHCVREACESFDFHRMLTQANNKQTSKNR